MEQKESKSSFNLWEYTYYRTVLFYEKYESRLGSGNSKNRGAFYVALYITFNLLTVYSALTSLIAFLDNNKEFMLLKLEVFFPVSTAFFIVALLLSLYFFANKRHDWIFEKYENESKQQKKQRGYLVIAYHVITYALLIGAGLLHRKFILGIV